MPDETLDISAMLADAPQISEPPQMVEPGQQPPSAPVGNEKPPVVEPQPKPEGAKVDGGKLGPDGKPIVAEPAKEPPQPPPVPQAPPAPSLSAADLQRQTETIAKMLEGAKASPDKPAGKPEPAFKIEIPAQLLTAMASEDPTERGTATNYVINGAMNLVYERVAKEMTSRIEQLVQSIPQVIERQTSSQTKAKEVFDDFYGAFPSLKNKALYPLIQQRAKELAAAKGDNFVWDEKFRDELGQDVMGLLAAVAGKPTTTQPPAAKPKEPPFQAGKTPRVDASQGVNPFLASIGTG